MEEMSTFLGMLLNKKKEENRPFNDGGICEFLSIFTWQNKNYVDLGMVFKQNFKYFKKMKKFT